MKDSLRRYVEAKRKSSASSEVLEAEAEKLYRHLLSYTRGCRDDGIMDFSTILESFYSDVLDLGNSVGCGAVKSSLTRRFKKIAGRYMVSDPAK